MDRVISNTTIQNFRNYLRQEEKAKHTIDNYLHDVRVFYHYANSNSVSKSMVMEFKASLTQKYRITSANSMIAALNAFLRFPGWEDCCIKQFKVQKKTYLPESKELTKEEYIRLVETAKKRGNERLNLMIQTICGTGIRVSELPFITVESVCRGEATVSCKKQVQNGVYRSGATKKAIEICESKRDTHRLYLRYQIRTVCESVQHLA